jgi:hypothetical protein
MPGLILIVYDTGCTVFISSLADHFCVEITCDAAINGIGKRSVKIAGPIAISFLDDKAQNYVTYESPRGFYMEDLNFGIFPSGQAEKIGWEFHVRELNPYFIADGHHMPLIKDHQTVLTWMAERRFAPPTVAAKQRFIKSFAQDVLRVFFLIALACPKYVPNTRIPRRISTGTLIPWESVLLDSITVLHALPLFVGGADKSLSKMRWWELGVRAQKRPTPRVTNSETKGPRATL